MPERSSKIPKVKRERAPIGSWPIMAINSPNTITRRPFANAPDPVAEMTIRLRNKTAPSSGGPILSAIRAIGNDGENCEYIAAEIANDRREQRDLKCFSPFSFARQRRAVEGGGHSGAGTRHRDQDRRNAAAIDAAFIDTQQERNAENRFQEEHDRQQDRHRRQRRQARQRADEHAKQQTTGHIQYGDEQRVPD